MKAANCGDPCSFRSLPGVIMVTAPDVRRAKSARIITGSQDKISPPHLTDKAHMRHRYGGVIVPEPTPTWTTAPGVAVPPAIGTFGTAAYICKLWLARKLSVKPPSGGTARRDCLRPAQWCYSLTRIDDRRDCRPRSKSCSRTHPTSPNLAMRKDLSE